MVEMENYFWIALGGALGTMGRYWCSGFIARLVGETFPWGTLTINVLGSFVIGWFGALTGSGGAMDVPADIRLIVMVGICGGFTTFSSFSLQTLELMQAGELLWAGAYVVGSVVVCLLAVWAGVTVTPARSFSPESMLPLLLLSM